MSYVPFDFPVLVVPDRRETWQHRLISVERDERNFVLATDEELRRHSLVDHFVFDAEGRTWRLNGMVEVDLKERPLWQRLCAFLGGFHDIRYDFSEEPEMSFGEIKAQILTILDDFRDTVCRTGPTGDTSDQTDILLPLEKFLQRVRDTQRPLELIALLYLHDF